MISYFKERQPWVFKDEWNDRLVKDGYRLNSIYPIIYGGKWDVEDGFDTIGLIYKKQDDKIMLFFRYDRQEEVFKKELVRFKHMEDFETMKGELLDAKTSKERF